MGRDQLEKMIQEREKEEDLAEKMAGLGIGQLIDTDAMEWARRGADAPDLDSDDDPDPEDDHPPANPLKLLASRELPYRQKKNDKDTDSIDPFAAAAVTKVDEQEPSSRFLPFSDVSDRSSARLVVTPPPRHPPAVAPVERTDPIPLPKVYNCRTQLMSLQESLALQKLQNERLREVQRKHAAERLSQRLTRGPVVVEDIPDTGQYRDQDCDENTDDDDDDDDDRDDEGGVTVQVDSYEDCPADHI